MGKVRHGQCVGPGLRATAAASLTLTPTISDSTFSAGFWGRRPHSPVPAALRELVTR